MSLERRLDTLERMSPAADRVEVVHLVPMGKRECPIRRAQVCGVTFDRADDETERSFLARVKAHIPVQQQRVILAF